MDPLVSVVIPVFNRASIVARTVESCLAQTYPHVDVIVVDDCSTDDLSSALGPFASNPQVRCLSHPQNLGVSSARNSGVEAAKGEYVAFLDSDDAWEPAKLERQVQLALQQSHQNFIIGTLTRIVNGTGNAEVRPKRRKPDDVAIGNYLFVDKVQRRLPMVAFDGLPLKGGCFAQTSSYFLPRDLARRTPFRVGLNQYEDMAFLIDLGDQGTDFLLVEEPLTIQHNDDRPGRLGARDDLKRGRQFIEAIGSSLSPEARLAFEATHLAHLHWKERPLHALSLGLRALIGGGIAPRSMLGILSRCVLGQAGQKALRARAALRILPTRASHLNDD